MRSYLPEKNMEGVELRANPTRKLSGTLWACSFLLTTISLLLVGPV